jgi:hypothetical protein
MAMSTAPALNFRISPPHKRNVDFSVKIGDLPLLDLDDVRSGVSIAADIAICFT